jgi:hypothetical protein
MKERDIHIFEDKKWVKPIFKRKRIFKEFLDFKLKFYLDQERKSDKFFEVTEYFCESKKLYNHELERWRNQYHARKHFGENNRQVTHKPFIY